MPLVSVVIPAFNVARYIGAALESVRMQRVDCEVVIVDDCSTDGTYELAVALSSQDQRIHIQRTPANSGSPAGPRNLAIRMASGRYVAFLDADDQWRASKLATQLAAMDSTGASLTCTGYTARWAQRQRTFEPARNISLRLMKRMNQVGLSTVVYDRERMNDIQFASVGHEDYHAWLKLLRAGHTFIGIRDDLATYLVRPGSVSSSPLRNIAYLRHVYETALDDSPTRAYGRALEYALLSRFRYSHRGRAILGKYSG